MSIIEWRFEGAQPPVMVCEEEKTARPIPKGFILETYLSSCQPS